VVFYLFLIFFVCFYNWVNILTEVFKKETIKFAAKKYWRNEPAGTRKMEEKQGG
jgi:hypothetical protein